MIHVVIPAAGQGRRFTEAGYPPKAHVLVDGVPMLRRVVGSLRPTATHRMTVVVTAPPPELGDDVRVIYLDQPTSGAVETILAVGIDDGPLLVANSDQLLGYGVNALLVGDSDATIAVFTSGSPAHSYVRLDGNGHVEDIAEKVVISSQAVAGVYYFRRGSDFRDAAEAVLKDERRVLGEYYVSTVLAEMIQRGARITTCRGPVHTLGTPEELDAYHAMAKP